MNKTNAAKQIIGSFEDIGKDIAREVVNAPKDIVGAALESLGTSSQKGHKGNPQGAAIAPVKQPDKALPPREWLAELSGMGKKQNAPTVQEIHEQEKREKDRKEQMEDVKATHMAPLQKMSSRQKRGQLFGNPQKSSERSKNSRND
jgi:hypothetical protein